MCITENEQIMGLLIVWCIFFTYILFMVVMYRKFELSLGLKESLTTSIVFGMFLSIIYAIPFRILFYMYDYKIELDIYSILIYSTYGSLLTSSLYFYNRLSQ